MTKTHYIILIGLFGGLLSIGVIKSLSQTAYERAEERIFNYKVNGIVKAKYQNPSNHNIPAIELVSGKRIRTVAPKTYSLIRIGDSLIKTKNSLYLDVYRNEKLYHRFNYMLVENFMNK